MRISFNLHPTGSTAIAKITTDITDLSSINQSISGSNLDSGQSGTIILSDGSLEPLPPSHCRQQWTALTTILNHTWSPSRTQERQNNKSQNPVEVNWIGANQKTLGTAIHEAMAIALKGGNLNNYSHQVQGIVQSVKDEGLLCRIEGTPLIELPVTYRHSSGQIGFNTRLDTLVDVDSIPTLIEWTYRPNRIPNLQALGSEKLAQLTGTLAACSVSQLQAERALLAVLYPFGRPDCFWIDDFDLLRQVWKTNLFPRLQWFFNHGRVAPSNGRRGR